MSETVLAWIIVAWALLALLPGMQWYKGPRRDIRWDGPGVYVHLAGNIALLWFAVGVLT